MRIFVGILLACGSYVGIAQDVEERFSAPSPQQLDELDPRYEETLRELVASPAGRAFLEALVLIDREYLYATDADTLLRGATAGLIEALDDPYSRYLDPDTVAALRAGEFDEDAVEKARLGDVGYVRVRSFQHDTVGALVNRALDLHLASGARALVLDLRGNQGGPVLQGLQVLDRFLSDGVLGFRRVRGVSVPIAYANPRALSEPLAVLVDSGTASTAEIVAGALQAYGRAQVVGSVTAGKGIGQSSLALPDGAELHLVSFEWLLPGFRSIDGSGLRPDVEIQPPGSHVTPGLVVRSMQDVAEDPALGAALKLLRDAVGDDLAIPSGAPPAPATSVGPSMLPPVPDEGNSQGD